MKRYLALATGCLVLLIALLVAIPFFIPADRYKARLVAMVEAKTGRTLVIDGPVNFTLFPNIGIEAEDVRFANAPWADNPYMSLAKHMHVSLQLRALIHGELRINAFTLVHPVLHLEVRADGTPNWDFDAPAGSFSANGQDASTPPHAKGYALTKLGLTAISLSDGFVSYDNKQTHGGFIVRDVNFDLAMPDLDSTFTANGSLILDGLPMKLALSAGVPRAFLAPGTTPLSVNLHSGLIDLDFRGTASPRESLGFAGDITLDVPSVRKLIDRTGATIPLPGGFGPLALKGKIKSQGQRAGFSDATIRFDTINATGDIAFDTTGKRPLIVGRLALDALNLNDYIDGPSSPARPAAKPAATPPAASFAPVTPGTGAAGGWSTEPIRLDGLGAVNTDLALSLGTLRWREFQTGAADLALRITDGVLAADLKKITLYQGTGTGSLRLDATGTPALTTAFTLTGVDVKPLLLAASGFGRLSGTGNASFNISANGSNQQEMIGTLSGKAEASIHQGSLSGVNVPGLLSKVSDIVRARQKGGEVNGWQEGTQNTAFSELAGSFNIARGVAANDDFRLTMPMLRVTGAGKTDILHRQLDYRLNPTVLPAATGTDGSGAMQGITVPFLVQGSWDSPAFRPDVKSLLLNPKETVETIRSLKDGGAKSVLKELLAPPDSTSQAQDKKPSPKQLLDNLLGR
ncbi:MAG: AsmA family protein [Parvibaculaceae bacterium]|nr:AsmA family protein [Parvibaculaceae bacterium]